MNDRPDARIDDDTSRDALRAQYAALRRLTARERLVLMDRLTELARSMAREGLRRRHAGATESELDERFAELVLGREVAARVRAQVRSRAPRSLP